MPSSIGHLLEQPLPAPSTTKKRKIGDAEDEVATEERHEAEQGVAVRMFTEAGAAIQAAPIVVSEKFTDFLVTITKNRKRITSPPEPLEKKNWNLQKWIFMKFFRFFQKLKNWRRFKIFK